MGKGNAASKHVSYDLTKAKTMLIKDSSLPEGYIVYTSYPIID